MRARLNQRVLVLNRLWQAVNIVGVKRAFSLLLSEHAQVVHAAGEALEVLRMEDWIAYAVANPPADDRACIHTVRWKLHLPQVILLRHYDRVPAKEVKFNRQNLFERDGYCCQYCAKEFSARDLNLDHVIPRMHGGRTSWENVVTSCVRCNARKANRLPHQAGMHLLRKPAKPKWRPFAYSVVAAERSETWAPFLGELEEPLPS
jgi:5-methylcytosine-specific restriction endonuclease McrA